MLALGFDSHVSLLFIQLISSVGRAVALHAKGHRFESYINYHLWHSDRKVMYRIANPFRTGSSPVYVSNDEVNGSRYYEKGSTPFTSNKHARVTQLEECLPEEEKVVGSSPTSCTNICSGSWYFSSQKIVTS